MSTPVCDLEDNINSLTNNEQNHPLRLSLFPNIPPYIRFVEPDQQYDPPLPKELQLMTWVAPSGISPIISECVKEAGFVLVEGQGKSLEDKNMCSIWDMLPATEKSKESTVFSGLSQAVKINQFPGLSIIGRKDCLWTSYRNMQLKFGQDHFNFLPKTYIVPEDRENLIMILKEQKKPMIVKPPNWFCGIGIKLINNIEDIPNKKNKMCVQEYLDNPFLIRGHKFDLRLYALLSSIDPVRIYLYEEGLVRFATEKYTNDQSEMTNNFIHLTNYSVNKSNKNEFVYNEKPGEYEGHKWNLGTLWKYFDEELGIDWRPIWEKVKEVCVKTVLCGWEHVKCQWETQLKSDYNCYKLWGLDIFIDNDMKPWLLEVNNIPSLHINTIDSFVNRPMVTEMFNILGLHIPQAMASKHKQSIIDQLGLDKDFIRNVGHDVRIYTRTQTEKEKKKEIKLVRDFSLLEDGWEDDILSSLTSLDIRTLIQAEEELSQTRSWSRVFPSPSLSQSCLPLLSPPSYRDLLLHAWGRRYRGNRKEGTNRLSQLCSDGHHLIVPHVE